jgi:predicted GIY-YIG superfamily endonuclease
MENQKKHYLYVLYNTKTRTPKYIGLSSSIKRRVKAHLKTKDFNGVLIIESFENKNEGLAAERSLIKFFSIFKSDLIVNSLYANYAEVIEADTCNKLDAILNGNYE